MNVLKLYMTYLLAQYSYVYDLQNNFNVKEISDIDKIIESINDTKNDDEVM